jgi:hypothetical protein
MSGDLTLALGRLLADPSLRETLRRDAAEASRVLDVDLRGIDADGLDRQAEALLEKRFHEVSKRLPRTVALLKDGAGRVFWEFAVRSWPEGHDRHLRDAAAFVAYLEERALPLCRSEIHRLQFVLGNSRLALRYAPDVWAGGRSRKAVQLLVRTGVSVRSFALYFGF